METITVHFILNGKPQTLTTKPTNSLLEVLRSDFGLTGTKDACGGEGECGACTVILDEKAVNACLVLIGQIEGRSVETIEGLKKGEDYHPIQKAYVEAGAVQCGFCIPGAIMSTKALLYKTLDPSEPEIREALSGNLCRCTGYKKMFDAVTIAARELKNEK